MISKVHLLVSKIKRTIRRKIDESKKKGNLVLNYNERDFSDGPLTYRCPTKKDTNFIEVSGEITAKANADKALFSIEFYDELARKVTCEQPFNGLSSNSNFSCYSYIKKGKFKLLIQVPSSASTIALKIRPSKDNNVSLLPGMSISQISLNFQSEIAQLVDKISKLRESSIVNEENIDDIFSGYPEKQLRVLLNCLYDHYKDLDYRVAYLIGCRTLELDQDLNLGLELKTSLNFNGEMIRLAQFIDNVKDMNIPGWNLNSRRLRSDITLWEQGFKFPLLSDQAYPKSKTVLYLLHNSLPYNSGGYATRTHGLLKCLNRSGCDIHGVTRPGYPSDHKKYISKPLPSEIPCSDIVDQVNYIRCSQKTRKSSLTLPEYVEEYSEQLLGISKQVKPYIVHAASNHPNGFAAISAARKLGIKSVYEVRGLWEVTRLSRQKGWDETDNFKFTSKMEAEACKQADKVLTITEALKDIMIARGVPREKITVVPNCVNVDDFTPFKDKNYALLEELSISAKDIVIGYIGSIVNYEGLDDLIESLRLIRSEGIENFKLLIVGDGAYLAYVADLVKKLGLDDFVIFTGRVPHELVDDYYSLVDITPFPRKPLLVCEAVSPLKPFEAMASGKALVVSSCAALKEIVTDGENGLVFEKGSVSDLASKLKELIIDSEKRDSLSRNGYEWVVKNRDWTYSANIINGVYDELLGEVE